MKLGFLKLSFIAILFTSFLCSTAYCADEYQLSKVVLSGDANDFYGNFYWPFGSAEFGSAENAFMTWERIDENNVAYYEGYLYFLSRIEREQLDEVGVKDTIQLDLTYDLEEMKVTGSFSLYTVTTMDFDKYQLGEGGDWINYANPQWHSKSAKEVVCETWMDINIDWELDPDNPTFSEKIIPVDVTFHAKVLRYGNPQEDAAEKYEEKTVTENLPVTVRIQMNSYGGNVYPQFGFWSQPGADYASRPSLSGSFQCSTDPCSTLQVEWKDAKEITVTGPNTISPVVDHVEFEMTENLEADSYTWIFSYKNNNGYWVQLETISSPDNGPLRITESTETSITEWRDLFYQYGEKVGDVRELEMKVVVSSEIDGSTVQSNEHLFKISVNEALSLSIDGPSSIINSLLNQDSITFRASGSGQGLDSVRWLDWYFYYKNEYGEWQLADKFVKDTGVADIDIPYSSTTGTNWDSWIELAGYHGQDVDDKKVLEMKVEVKAISFGETEITTSNAHFFTVEYIKSFLLVAPKTMEVTPVGVTEETIFLDFGTLEQSDPIELIVVQKPHFIEVEFKPNKIETNIFTTAEAVIRVSTDPSTIGEPLLPTTGRLVIEARSGGTSDTAEIELSIVPAEWLVMYYSCTNTYGASSIQKADELNLLEIINSSFSTNDDKVGVLAMIELEQDWINLDTGGTQPFDVHTLIGQNTYFFEINGGNVTRLGEGGAGRLNMGDGSILKTFVEEAMTRIPAKHKMLIISDHGEGVRGVVFDKGSNDSLDVLELKEALDFNPVEVLVFDACYMGQIEVLYELRNCVDYIVASETRLPLRGMNYRKILELVTDGEEPRQAAISIVKNFLQPSQKDYHLSAIDTSKLGDLVYHLNKLSEAYIQLFTVDPPLAAVLTMVTVETGVQSVETKTLKDGPLVIGHPYYDIGLIDTLSMYIKVKDREYGWKKRETQEAFDGIMYHSSLVYNKTKEAVLEQAFTVPKAFGFWNNTRLGMSIFFWPNVRYSIQNRVLADYEKYYVKTRFYKDTSWYEVVQNYLLTQMDPVYSADIFTESLSLRLAMSGSLFKLSHSQHELYLHIETEDGLHVGVNSDHWSRTMIDEDIPGSFYYDFHNGSKLIYVPEEYTEFTLTIDGDYMEEDIEDYEIECMVLTENRVVSTITIGGEIELDTQHTTEITITDTAISASLIEIIELESSSKGGFQIPGHTSLSILIGLLIFAIFFKNHV